MDNLTSAEINDADPHGGFHIVDENERASFSEAALRDASIDSIRRAAALQPTNPDPGYCILSGCGEEIPESMLSRSPGHPEFVRFCSAACCRLYEKEARRPVFT